MWPNSPLILIPAVLGWGLASLVLRDVRKSFPAAVLTYFAYLPLMLWTVNLSTLLGPTFAMCLIYLYQLSRNKRILHHEKWNVLLVTLVMPLTIVSGVWTISRVF